MSLSKNQLKTITSLNQKKYRTAHHLFVAEGTKIVAEFLNSNFELEQLFCVNNASYKNLEKVTEISERDLSWPSFEKMLQYYLRCQSRLRL